MKKITLPLLLVSLLLGTSCTTNNSSINSNGEVAIKSPNEDGGLEGNADKDTVPTQDSSILKEFLLKAAEVQYFSYDVTSTVKGSETHFVNYFTPYAWYEENDDSSKSFGYAEEYKTGAVFKYYISEDGQTAIPSVYEYSGLGENITKLTTLYSPLTMTHINLLKSNMDEFSAISYGVNKFLITDSNTASIFQFMTTFGNSITNYLNSTYIEILDEESLKFKAICDLGDYGAIEAIFTPDKRVKNAFVNDLVIKGELVGVDYHEEVYDFLNNKMATNNFVLHGIKQKNNISATIYHPYTIYCTNDYFYLEYNQEFLNSLSEEERSKYKNWGYALVPSGTTVQYLTEYNGVQLETQQTLNYTSCYKFSQTSDGSFAFDFFKGPIENGITYLEVESLPIEGKTNTFYIIEEEGEKVVYEWTQVSDGVYGYSYYSTWYNSVSDFYINDTMATFYLSGTPLTSIGALYFEKSLTNENEYFSNNSTVLGALANGLFGWGFQATDTWMDYIEGSKIRINKDSNDVITSYDIGLDIENFSNGVSVGIGEISYTIDNFGKGNVAEIDEFLASALGGA